MRWVGAAGERDHFVGFVVEALVVDSEMVFHITRHLNIVRLKFTVELRKKG
jgi:hypothetical protein